MALDEWMLILNLLSLLCTGDAVDQNAIAGSETRIPCRKEGAMADTFWQGPPNLTQYSYPGQTTVGNPAVANRDRLSIGNSTRELMIINTAASDEGVYRCFVVGGGADYGETKLFVNVQPSAAAISNTEVLGNGRVIKRGIQDKDVTLRCSSNGGRPAAVLKWYGDSTNGNPLSSTEFKQDNGDGTFDVTQSYTFTPRRNNDRASYFCRLEHVTGNGQAQVELYLWLKPTNPVITGNTGSDGTNISAKCTTDGCRPEASITWSYRGTTYSPTTTSTWVPASETYSMTSTLTRPVTKEDNTQPLKCLVSHPALTTPKTGTTTLSVFFAPVSVSLVFVGNSDIIANGQNTVTLKCTTSTSNPAATLTWKKNNVAITSSLQPTDSNGDYGGKVRTQQLRLTPTRNDDGHVISCSAQNQQVTHQPVSGTKTLDLRYYPVVTLPDGATQTVIEGNNTILRCQASSKPASSFAWYFQPNANAISESSGAVSDNRFNYGIHDVRRTHVGIYRCEADNQLQQTASESLTLKVLFAPLSVSVVFVGNSDIIANGQNTVTLKCTTSTSNPAATLTWKKNNVAITSSLQPTDSDGDYGGKVRTQQLRLTPTRNDDGHVISCSAQNQQVTHQPVSGTKTLDLRYNPVVSLPQAPNVEATEGTIFTLQCQAHSKPASRFYWYRSGVVDPIRDSSAAVASNRFDCTINVVNRTDEGGYICKADNGIQNSHQNQLTLRVRYPPDVRVSGTNKTSKDPKLTFTCEPTGYPATYHFHQWKHTWPGDRTVIRHLTSTQTTGTESKLELENLGYQDSGIYSCYVDNGIPDTSTVKKGEIYVNVKSPPFLLLKELRFAGKLKTETEVGVTFFSNADGDSVTAYKDTSDTPVGHSSMVATQVTLSVYGHNITDTGIRSIVTIPIATEADFTTYQITVVNEIDSVTYKIRIDPESAPDKPTEFTNYKPSTSSVTLTWIAGFHGGSNQTFIIQYSTDGTTWKNGTSVAFGKKSGSTGATLEDLEPGTDYHFRIYAYNEFVKGVYSEVIRVTTMVERQCAQEDSNVAGVLAGGIVGGMVIGIILTIAVVFILRRRGIQLKNKDENRKRNVEAHVYYNTSAGQGESADNSSPIVTTYETLGIRREGEQQSMYESLQPEKKQGTSTQKIYENTTIG